MMIICEVCGDKVRDPSFTGVVECECGAKYEYDEGVRITNVREMMLQALIVKNDIAMGCDVKHHKWLKDQ